MRVILLAGMLALMLPGSTWAASAWRDTVAADSRRMIGMTERLITSPLRANTREWVGVGAFAAAVAFTAALDGDVRSDAATWDDSWMNNVDDIGHTFQQTGLFFGTAGAFYVGGLAANKPAWRRVGQELVVASVVAATGTQLVKYSTGRARPDQGHGPGHFVGPTLDDQFHSLWSGDVTKAFTLASVLSAEARHPAVTIALYSLATATAFQRIHTERHWFSDVVSAAVWSTAVGIGTVKIGKAKIGKAKSNGRESESELGLQMHLIPTGITLMW